MTESNDHLDDLLETAHAVAAAHQVADSEPDDRMDTGLWAELEKLGFTGLTVDESLGGAGGDLVDAATVLSGLGTSRTPYAEAVLVAGPALQQANLELPSGPMTAARFSSEIEDAGEVVLRGIARSVPWALGCKWIVLLSSVPSPVLYVVALDDPGVRIETGVNLAGEARDDVVLDGVRPVAIADLGYDEARLWDLRAAASRCVSMAAVANLVVDATNRHVRQREQFGRPLRSFQVIQHSLARMAADALVMQIGAATAAEELRGGSLDTQLLVAATKSECSALVRPLTAAAHQAHGAIGFTREHVLGALTSRLWAWREEYGNERFWQNEVGRLSHKVELWGLVTGLPSLRKKEHS